MSTGSETVGDIDYLLEHKLIRKVWICNSCTFQNHPLWARCEMCNLTKSIPMDIRYVPCDYIKPLEITRNFDDNNNNNNNNNNTTNHQIKSKPIPWKCKHCLRLNENNHTDQCKACECAKPIKMNKSSRNELAVFGFCREFTMNEDNDHLLIPFVIKKLCQRYSKTIDRFVRTVGGRGNLSRPFEQYQCLTGGGNHVLLSETMAMLDDELPSIYQWRVRLKTDKKFWSTDQIYGVMIGVSCKLRWIEYGIYSNGKYNKYKQFCPSFNHNDVITLQLDMERGTVSYGINSDWYGVAFDIMDKEKQCVPNGCRFAVSVNQLGVAVEMIDFEYMNNSLP